LPGKPAPERGDRMKLLTISAYFEAHRGGVEIVAGRLARALAERGFEVTWLSTSVVEPPVDIRTLQAKACNFTERRLGFPWPLIGFRGLARIWRTAREHEAVLVHDSLYLTSIAAFVAARLQRRPFLVVQHVGEVPYRNPLLRLLMRLANAVVARPLLARADQVVFISRTTGDHFRQVRYARSPEYVFNGVDGRIFRPVGSAGEQADARRCLGLPLDRTVALFVGRFVEKKGLHLLRRAVAARPDVAWAFAGWGPEDPETWAQPNVTVFRGLEGPSLAELYRAADALVLPSVGEGFPLVVQEALASGLPVVCGEETLKSDEAAAPFLEGVALDVDDPLPGLVGALDRALASDVTPKARSDFTGGRYAWDIAADRYAALLRDLTCPPAQTQPQPSLRSVA
jgi:glycosyltransferase involved in cell wall biosynthesis